MNYSFIILFAVVVVVNSAATGPIGKLRNYLCPASCPKGTYPTYVVNTKDFNICKCVDLCKKCNKFQKCTLKHVLCVQSPCPQIAVCEPKSECQGGRVYSECASPCEKTCSSMYPLCILQCKPGCTCPTETPFLKDDGTCTDYAGCLPEY